MSWHIYDHLVDGISTDSVVEACLVGNTWTLVDSEGTGVAMTYRRAGNDAVPGIPNSGKPLRELAAGIRSWDLAESSLGMAAVNAFYNVRDRIETWTGRSLEDLRSCGAFASYLEKVKDRKVAVVGHFPGLEGLAETCELSILERNPGDGDLPDFACEYVLPEQDYVFITGTALTNKTMPRLLELSAQATVALVGPTVPLVPWWFDMGVDILAGAVVVEKEQVWRHCQEGGHRGIFELGAWMIEIRRAA